MYSKIKSTRKGFFGLLILTALLIVIAAGCGKTAKQKIVGKWSPSTSNGSEIYNFTENGELITTVPSIPEKREKYRFIDDENLEIESQSGEKVTGKVTFTDDDKTMNVDVSGTKRTYKRQ